jgi:hypothetical protein
MQPAFYDDSETESETEGETQRLLTEANKKFLFVSERQVGRTKSSHRVGIINHDESSVMNMSGIYRARTIAPGRFKSANEMPDTNRNLLSEK